METLGHDCTIDDCRALETSLVEWKRRDGLSGRIYGLSLGNFLSGMETTRDAPSRPFAHALETSLVEWKLQNDAVSKKALLALETSLVEWKHIYTNVHDGLSFPLETSLVEWKPDGGAPGRVYLRRPWKLP